MSADDRLEASFARWVERLVVHGERLDPAELCAGDPDRAVGLRRLVERYDRLARTLDGGSAGAPDEPATPEALPQFDGFRTIERLGSGGSGEVFKLQDLKLGRLVAAKVVRPDNPLHAGLSEFLREARALALFDDPRIVRIFEFREQAVPPVLLMEYVEGFDLARIGPSLDWAQRARIVAEVAETMHRAHVLGVQHRDLKPANILLDAALAPRILDFGLSRGEPHRGHGLGTPAYMAPEQLDPERPIDARTDVHALGVILYQLLCGQLPHAGGSVQEIVAAIRAGRPRLPCEIEPGIPEPLQAIALKALEHAPEERYATARDMAADLRRYLDGHPVLARPTLYQTTLDTRIGPHLEQIREWLRLKLIYPHEAEHLSGAYGRLRAREDDWIVESRTLSYSQIALYLGAFLLVCGALLYCGAYFLDAVTGLVGPTLVLALPFAGLNLAARLLVRRERRAVAVAFYLAAVLLLPLFLLTVFEEAGLWTASAEDPLELFGGAGVSNRQLQLAALAACAWSYGLARTTRTVALGSCFTLLAIVLHLALLGDFGLRTWVEDSRWDVLALHLVPLLVLAAAAGALTERRRQAWLARPLYLAAVVVFVTALELLALDGRAFGYLGLSLAALQQGAVSNPQLLDTCVTMSLNGLAFYAVAQVLDRSRSALIRDAAWLLFAISPFAILEPLSYLNGVGEYSRHFDWLYLGLALAITVASQHRQRRSFYYAGLLNTGVALWLVSDHYEWFDAPAWGVVVGGAGLATLAWGLWLNAGERGRPSSGN